MYPKNNASPEEIAVGAIFQISDGAIQTTGASVRVKAQGQAAAAGGGTLTCDTTSGIWYYTPTQAETNYSSFKIFIYKSSCTSACVTVVTTAESTAGKVSLGSSQTADISGITDLATLLSRITAARAGYFDNLNIGGPVASAANVAAITQAQRVRISIPGSLERPDSGSVSYRIWIYAYDEQHQAEDLDSNPTVTAENNAGTDRSGNLGTVTKPGATTGIYYFDYTVADSHAIEGLVFKVDATEGAVTTQYPAATIVTDTTAVDFTSADRTNLDAILARIPQTLNLTASGNIGIDWANVENPATSVSLNNTELGIITGGIDATTANQLADALLKRDWSLVSGEAARSVLNALRVLRNKVSESGGTLTVTKEDDATPAFTAAVTTDSGADPITAIDPV